MLALGVAMTATLSATGAPVGAVSGGSASPDRLAANGQAITITYSGKDTRGPASNLMVEECIADDRAVGFDPNRHCSPVSRQFFFGVPESGSVNYGGDAKSNPTAPFVGVDPNNGEWSICDSSSGVTNYASGFFRMADFPADQADDYFIPFRCENAGASGDSRSARASDSFEVGWFAAALAGGVAVLVAGDLIIRRRRSALLPLKIRSRRSARSR